LPQLTGVIFPLDVNAKNDIHFPSFCFMSCPSYSYYIKPLHGAKKRPNPPSSRQPETGLIFRLVTEPLRVPATALVGCSQCTPDCHGLSTISPTRTMAVFLTSTLIYIVITDSGITCHVDIHSHIIPIRILIAT
jgi:hypothetical protein